MLLNNSSFLLKQKKISIIFTITKSSEKLNNLIISHIFFLWTKFVATFNATVGKDFIFFNNNRKSQYRYTYSGSPHAQTKKGRDFLLNNFKITFGIQIYNIELIEKVSSFLALVPLQYKSLNTGLKVVIKTF